jgi:hypothetical protein
MTYEQAMEQIEGLNRNDLRAACKAASIQYSKLDTPGMRQALIKRLMEENAAETQAEVFIDDGNPSARAIEIANAEAAAPQGWDVAGGETDAPTPATGVKIEKNRPQQNGVTRPSAGGKCRAVWDALDAFAAANNTTVAGITSKQVKSLAAANGFNANNASIEFYQWRKYNGVTGRAAKE